MSINLISLPHSELEQENLLFEDSDKSEDGVDSDKIPVAERNLRMQAYDQSISAIISMINDQKIILARDYQRNYIWDDKKASLLIESILINMPIPPLYMSEEMDGTWNVVDGLQRLNVLRRFSNDEFKLSGLDIVQELNGFQYSTLNAKASRIFCDTTLRTILIFKESHPEITYEIFMRLNQGAIELSEQEVRNSLYRGRLNELVRELRKYPPFLTMLGLSEPHKKFLDAELILRYLAISDNYDVKNHRLSSEYAGKIRNVLNRYVDKYSTASQDTLNHLKDKFLSTVDKVYNVFGENAFQRISPDGTLESKGHNRAIMDIIMVSFEHVEQAALIEHKDEIIDLLRRLPQEDRLFDSAISEGTSDRNQLEYRLSRWTRQLKEALE